VVQPVTASATYLPGGWVGIAGQDTWLLARLTPDHPLVAECWTLVDDGADADHVLGAILQAGFGVVSDFALATTRDASVRVLLRGAAQATWTQGGQVSTMSAEGAPIWQEHTLTITDGTLTLRRPGAASGPGFPVRLAVVMSDELTVRQTAPGAQESASAPLSSAIDLDVAAPPIVTMAAPAVASTPEALPVAEVSSVPSPALPSADSDPSVDIAAESSSQERLESDATAEDDQDESIEVVPLDLVEDISAAHEDSPEDLDQEHADETPLTGLAEDEGAAEAADLEASGDEDTGTGYDHLFGATQNLLAVAAAPVAEPEEAEALEPAANANSADTMHAPPDGEEAGSSAPSRPDDTLLPGDEQDISLIDALPWQVGKAHDDEPVADAPMASAPDYRAPVPVPSSFTVNDDESSEQTISRAKLMESAPAGVGLDPRPTVLAARCADGHLSPANAGICRVCRAPMPAQEPFTVQRPLLGTLRFSTGDIVSLDKGVVMGRAPHSPIGDGRDRPHVMQLASPENDISRTHLEVSLDGWHVYVEDMGSTNGTAITLPGQPPQQLRAHDAQLIEPGTVVTLADEVSFTFEVDT
jgi:hypothetical protein